MAIIAGADGCPAGWICISKDLASGQIKPALYPNARSLIFQKPSPQRLAIDIPIGLPAAGPRECDQIARRLLGSRACCVFSAPIRPAIDSTTRRQASQINTKIDGRGVGCQAWGIYSKIREVDQILSENKSLQNRIFEVHPEVCFCAWNGTALQARKKTPQGLNARRTLIDRHFGPKAFDLVRDQFLRKAVQSDDIADAFAALWTAERIFRHQAVVCPQSPPIDSMGLLMRIVY